MTKSTEIHHFGARFLSFTAGRLANRFSHHSPYRSPTRRLREASMIETSDSSAAVRFDPLDVSRLLSFRVFRQKRDSATTCRHVRRNVSNGNGELSAMQHETIDRFRG